MTGPILAAADALLAAPGNDVDQMPDGYPCELDEQGDPTINGRCTGCGVFWPGDCTCRPGGPRSDLDDPAVTLHVYDEVDLDMIERVF